jgi:uncharacterized membrane protein
MADPISSSAGPVDEGAAAGMAVPRRLWEIDAARGVAILMMVLYHFVYDLEAFGGYDIKATTGFWGHFASVTGALFVYLAGISLTLGRARHASTAPSPGWRRPLPRAIKRGLWILMWGMAITVVTWLLFGDEAIVFGILHLIGTSILLAYPLLRFRRLLAVLGLTIVLVGLAIGDLTANHPWLLWLGIPEAGHATLDYRPLFPWFGVFLLGVYAGKTLYEQGRRRFALPDLGRTSGVSLLSFLGRHSLVIYLVHQPVLLALLAALGVIDIDLGE